jgi:hypothetical protein
MEMTVDEIGLMLVQASKRMPKEKRASFQEVILASLACRRIEN